ncbi:hypothetical protein AKJ41_05475 [candidate division MSBL1 archaeon SCGC-AAA259O05]|uniref:Hydrogenase n=1 Tax=candidate division MSBL1 archaeon SCGC-AAA259O05 TaxID=1698271 RepID=A0A133UZ05_9EURY|nr:hypothetical protein AKJ41_05475 [candidate division MSBL1 archaeon SCGC-AAA259O05]
MCLAVPGEILEMNGNKAKVGFGRAEREVQLNLIENPSKGDYVLVHVGYAIQILSPEKAKEMIESWNEVARARTEEKWKEKD